MNETVLEPTPEVILPPGEAAASTDKEKSEAKPVGTTYVPVPPPNRFKRFMRSATRWVIVVLLAFLIGIAVMAIPYFRTLANLKDAEKERDQFKFALNMQGKMLISQQSDRERLIVLRTLSEVQAASLALISGDEINLPLFIDKAAQTMKAVPDTLMESQQATVTKIQQKLLIAQEKAKSDLLETKPELDLLLVELKENLRNLDGLLNPYP